MESTNVSTETIEEPGRVQNQQYAPQQQYVPQQQQPQQQQYAPPQQQYVPQQPQQQYVPQQPQQQYAPPQENQYVYDEPGGFLSGFANNQRKGSNPVKLGFDWGAFYWGWIYSAFKLHQAKITLITLAFEIFVPFGWLISRVYLGTVGSELAFAGDANLTKESYLSSRKSWAISGGIIATISILLFMIYIGLTFLYAFSVQ